MGDFGLLFLFCIAVGRSLGLRAPAAWQSRGVFHNIISFLTRKTLRFYLDSSAKRGLCVVMACGVGVARVAQFYLRILDLGSTYINIRIND